MSKLRHTHTKKPSAASEDKVSVCIPAQKSAWTSGKEASKTQEWALSSYFLGKKIIFVGKNLEDTPC